MSAPEDPLGGFDPQRFHEVLNTVHEQVATALWLSAGMLCAVAAIGCIAFAWRRAALCWGLLYSATLCFVHNGHAEILGPVGCGIAVVGFFLAGTETMIHFIDSVRDGELIAELKDESVLAPDVIARIDESMGRPESGTLDDFLLAGADLIPEKAWLYWLIRRHGCHRFGLVAWLEEAAEWSRGGVPPEANLPFRRCNDGGILVAVMRPDRLQATEARLTPTLSGLTPTPSGLTPAISRLKAPRLHWAAATLREMRKLRSAWQARSDSDPVMPFSALPDRIGEMNQGAVGLSQRRG